jgi:hypothetical protein
LAWRLFTSLTTGVALAQHREITRLPMNALPRLLAAALILLPITALFAEPDTNPRAKEYIAVMNSVSRRVNSGDIKAMEDLLKIPPDYAFHPLILHVVQNTYLQKPQQKLIADKAALTLTQLPDWQEQFLKLFRKQDVPKNALFGMRQQAAQALQYMRTKSAITILATAVTEDAYDDRGMYAHSLATMNIPGAPFSEKTWQQSWRPAGIERWKSWWSENQAAYAK